MSHTSTASESVRKFDIKIPDKSSNSCLRLVSFNVNGVKTLKSYYPWNEISKYNDMLTFMKADVVTFQELKLQRGDIDYSIADLPDYKSFITIPKARKGYSGVGVFVRIPNDMDNDVYKESLNVVRVEEGITGTLSLPYNEAYSYQSAFASGDLDVKNHCIGGYPDIYKNRKVAEDLDSQGRCVIVELSFNVVVISVYCPANSFQTEEGEEYRMLFLKCLFERAANLKEMGKSVIIMGDINVSRELIDNDEIICDGVKNNVLKLPKEPISDESEFEELNKEEVVKFSKSTPSRELLDYYIHETTGLKTEADQDKCLFDVIRESQGRRMKMYTCWNTLKNRRSVNKGSRIDLILTTEDLKKNVEAADIWPFILGSDHCPIMADIDMKPFCYGKANEFREIKRSKTHPFEAKSFYKLHAGKSIDSFFKPRSKSASTPVKENQAPTQTSKRKQELYNNTDLRKGKSLKNSTFKSPNSSDQLSIGNFFFSLSSKENPENNNTMSSTDSSANKKKASISVDQFNNILLSKSSTPCCEHNEPCVLRSVKKKDSANMGKKFWACARASSFGNDEPLLPADSQDERQCDLPKAKVSVYSCGFFKWASK
ncbi:nuclease activity protein [[Candida] boidinii]|nr:nuclease activity protein [[Candida] boidinii]